MFFVLTHVVALGAMALVLRSGMDPGAGSVAERMAWVAAHPGAWRLGWLPWQLSAASDLWVSLALAMWARAKSDALAMRVAIAGIALDLAAVVPEQRAEAMLGTSFLDVSGGTDVDAWRAAWSLYAGVTGVWANALYTVMTACWFFVARRSLGRGVVPLAAEIALVVLFTISGALTLAACLAASDTDVAFWFVLSSGVNGLAFPGLVLWTLALAWRLRAAR